MIYATVKLVESSLYTFHELGSGVAVRQEVVHETRPMGQVDNGAIVDESMEMCVVLQIVFDGLLYQLETEYVALSEARSIVEDLITSQRAGAEFDQHGNMVAMKLGGGVYVILESELIGTPDSAKPSFFERR